MTSIDELLAASETHGSDKCHGFLSASYRMRQPSFLSIIGTSITTSRPE